MFRSTSRLSENSRPITPARRLARFSAGLALLAAAAGLSSGFFGKSKKPDYLGPVAVVADKDAKVLYVAEQDGRQVAIVDIASGKVTGEIGIDGPAGALALSADGSKLFVSCSIPEGQVCVIDTAKAKIAARVDVGHTPVGLVPSPDGGRVYVCNRFNNEVAVVDLAAKKMTARAAVLREPFAIGITPDGKTLYVANHLPAGAADQDYVGAAVSVIDTASMQVVTNLPLPNGSSGVRGVCVSPDGKQVYVTHTLAHYQLPTTQLERGWMNVNALSVIDTEKVANLNTVLLDDVTMGAANPWGVSCSADGKWLAVAHAGTHEVSVIDRAGLLDKLAKAQAGQRVTEATASAADVPTDLSFVLDVRRRIKLSGKGPRGAVMAGGRVYAAEYFADALGVVDLLNPELPKVSQIALGPTPKLSVERHGESLFNDAEKCFQKWQSCASCHPDDRVDAFNWDLLNDGIGTPKNTRNMLLTHKTPPVMSLGVREAAEKAVRSGFRFIQFAVVSEEDASAVDAYLKSLQPVPSPHLVKGKLSASAKRGKAVFEKAGCADCHPAPLFTNLQEYNLGFGTNMETNKAFDTSTLVEVWRTAPYLHDGRSVTIMDVITRHNPNDTHGRTKNLSEADKKDLAEYVLSL